MKIGLTVKQKEYITANYPHKGAEHCINALKISKGQLVWFCHKNNIRITKTRREEATKDSIIKARNSFRKKHPHKVNIENFYSVSTPETAYILGMLWADGYINPPHAVTVECLSDDIDKIEKIFNSTGEWARYNRIRENRKPQSTLHTSNRELVEHLSKHYYTSKNHKSACSIIDTIPDELLCYWFRGLVDGDGCFYISPDYKSRQFCITSSYEQDWNYMKNIFNKLGVRYNIKKQISSKGDKYSQIRVTSPFDIKTFGEWIYKDYVNDKIGLPRKYEKWKLISESCKAKKRNTKSQ